METSESIKNISAALVKYHAKAETVTRDRVNPHFKNDYATLDNVLDTIRPILAEVGLSILQLPVGENGLTTMLLHESGEFIKETYVMPSKSNDPQGNGSRLTYQRRYALGAFLGISTEKDDDGNAATKAPTKIKLALNDANYPKVIAAIKDGFTIGQVRQKYEVSKEVEEQILIDTK